MWEKLVEKIKEIKNYNEKQLLLILIFVYFSVAESSTLDFIVQSIKYLHNEDWYVNGIYNFVLNKFYL